MSTLEGVKVMLTSVAVDVISIDAVVMLRLPDMVTWWVELSDML